MKLHSLTVCFELAPKETINELYVVNTNSIHHHFPTEQGCLCNTFASTATTGLVGKGIDLGGVGGGVNMIKQHIKFKIKIINIWYILYMLHCPRVLTHRTLCSQRIFCLSLRSSPVPVHNWAQSDKITNSHKNEIYNENRTYAWESVINKEPEFQ